MQMIPRGRRRRQQLWCLWFVILNVDAAAAPPPPAARFDNLHFFQQSVAQSSTTFGLLRSIPIFQQQYRQRRRRQSSSNRHNADTDTHDGTMTTIIKEQAEEDNNDGGSIINNNHKSGQQRRVMQVIVPAAVQTKHEKKTDQKKKKKRRKLFKMLPTLPTSAAALSGLSSSTGFFYGLDTKTVEKATKQQQNVNNKKTKPLAMKEALGLTLDELRIMRQEMEALRKEMEVLKRQLAAGHDYEHKEEHQVQGGEEGREEEDADGSSTTTPRTMALSKRQREFDKIARDVEKWAEKLLFQDNDNGWTEVQCNKMLKSALNKDGQTRAFLQWLKDARGVHANPNDNREYPCIRMESTIDAPIDIVCMYLAQKERLPEYNDLVMNQKDVEEIAPHAKICWSQTPSLLFIKPRDFITFCHHKWLKDGTQVVVNQALDEHPKKEKLVQGRAMAYALRGANYISRDPQNPQTKTRIYIIAHGSPGVGVPDWACRTAINALVPIEPFKFFAKLNESIKRARPALEEEIKTLQQDSIMNDDDDGTVDATTMVSTSTGRSKRPAGLAQLGYACFWPNGGGLVKGWQPPSSAKTGSGSSSVGSSSSGDGSSSSSSSNTEIVTPQVISSNNDNDNTYSRVEIAEEDSASDIVPQQQKDPAEVGLATEPPSSPNDVVIERTTTTLGDENDDSDKERMPGKDNVLNHDNNTQYRQHYEAVGVGGGL